MIDNHNPPKISSGAEEEREGERREKLQCINDPCVPTRRARCLARSLARRNAPSAGPAGRGRHCHPMDSAALAALRGEPPGRALPKGSWRNSWRAGPPSFSSLPPPRRRPPPRAASVRSAGAAPLRSARLGSAPLRRGSGGDTAGRGAPDAQHARGSAGSASPPGLHFIFLPPLPLRFPKRSVLGEMIHYLFLDFYKANCGPRCCHGIFFVRTL